MKKLMLIATIAISSLMADGAVLYKKCAGCHGANGEKSALGKSAIINKIKPSEIVNSLKAYKKGSLNRHGMGMLMKSQTASLTDEQIKEIAKFIGKK